MVLIFSPYLLICDIHIHFFWLNGFGYIVNVVFSAVIKNVLVLFPIQEKKQKKHHVTAQHKGHMHIICSNFVTDISELSLDPNRHLVLHMQNNVLFPTSPKLRNRRSCFLEKQRLFLTVLCPDKYQFIPVKWHKTCMKLARKIHVQVLG